MIHRIDIND